jgi:hypothetical protein
MRDPAVDCLRPVTQSAEGKISALVLHEAAQAGGELLGRLVLLRLRGRDISFPWFLHAVPGSLLNREAS